jgi:hypothetical protein
MQPEMLCGWSRRVGGVPGKEGVMGLEECLNGGKEGSTGRGVHEADGKKHNYGGVVDNIKETTQLKKEPKRRDRSVSRRKRQ